MQLVGYTWHNLIGWFKIYINIKAPSTYIISIHIIEVLVLPPTPHWFELRSIGEGGYLDVFRFRVQMWEIAINNLAWWVVTHCLFKDRKAQNISMIFTQWRKSGSLNFCVIPLLPWVIIAFMFIHDGKANNGSVVHPKQQQPRG